jgi:hypothetical protein
MTTFPWCLFGINQGGDSIGISYESLFQHGQPI